MSSVSVAEISITASLGKFTAPQDLLTELDESGFLSLPLEAEHAARLRDLPRHHRDPFDRMLIGQAQVEQLTVATVDPQFAAYEVALLAR